MLQTYSVKAGSSLTLPNLSSGGYGTVKTQTSASYINGQKITINSDMTLYCLEPYTVKIYDGSTLLNTYSVVRGKNLTLPNYSSVNGIGYSTNSSATSATYSNGQLITVTSNLTLYRLTEYTVTLYKYDSAYSTLSCVKGKSVTLPTCSVNSDDEAFYGWATTSGSTTIRYVAGDAVTPTSNMSLYAVFSYDEIEYETITANIVKGQVGRDEYAYVNLTKSATAGCDGVVTYTASGSYTGGVTSGSTSYGGTSSSSDTFEGTVTTDSISGNSIVVNGVTVATFSPANNTVVSEGDTISIEVKPSASYSWSGTGSGTTISYGGSISVSFTDFEVTANIPMTKVTKYRSSK